MKFYLNTDGYVWVISNTGHHQRTQFTRVGLAVSYYEDEKNNSWSHPR